jgi:hypothetical protein
MRLKLSLFYPEVDEKRLWNFWHFRQVDGNICDVF